MRIAVSTAGSSLDAWVGADLESCRQFLVVDAETMETIIVAVPSEGRSPQQRVATLLRAILAQGAEIVIAGHVSEACRQSMASLGIEAIEVTSGITARQAIESYVSGGDRALAAYEPLPQRIAVASLGDNLDATLHPRDEPCTAFVLVDPEAMTYQVIRVEAGASLAETSVNAVRAAARHGATTVITSGTRPACCAALNLLGITVVLADPAITVRQAIDQYRQGLLKPSYWHEL